MYDRILIKDSTRINLIDTVIVGGYAVTLRIGNIGLIQCNLNIADSEGVVSGLGIGEVSQSAYCSNCDEADYECYRDNLFLQVAFSL